jgi:SAM-dependent methyltransferase
MKSLKKMVKPIMKLDKWAKGVLFLAVILIICLVMNLHIPLQEGFVQQKKFVMKEGVNCYDDFYSEIYDDLVYDEVKNDFEIGELNRLIQPTKRSRILDVGSGSGHHVSMMKKFKCLAEGIDISPSMVKKAKKKYKDCKFKEGNALNNMLYPRNSFSTVTCFYFTIYYMEDKKKFINNVYDWLMPGGYFLLHLVNRDKFDPILHIADPLHIVSAQKYAKKRITNSLVKFKDFQYKANFKLDKENDLAEFKEDLIDDKTKNVRQNIHKLYMIPQKSIISLAKQAGFILKGKVNMVATQYEYQYLYLMYKPE